MEEEGHNRSRVDSGTSSMSNDASSSHVHEEIENGQQPQERNEESYQRQRQPPLRVSYRVNISISNMASSAMQDDVWSCLIVSVTFCLLTCMTLVMGIYGSSTILLGPNCSRLIQASSILVQSIQVQEVGESIPGPMLYGFYAKPPLDVKFNWSENHNVSVSANNHQEWLYFLNRGSKVHISYSVDSPSPLLLVIAQGKENLIQWIEDPSYPNTTLSWEIIHGSGEIQLEIPMSESYYIAVGNLNSDDVQVRLDLNMNTFAYDTGKAHYKCYLSNNVCNLKLALLRENAAVITSSVPEQGTVDEDLYVKLSYEPRWSVYIAGSGVATALALFACRYFSFFRTHNGDGVGIQTLVGGSERAPLLGSKDDDLLSWGSSYDSVSHDEEEDLEDWQATGNNLDGKRPKEGESNNPRRVCVVCLDAPRDCFFLPCGHCATCFTCGSRIAEEAGNCPICRRNMKKVRKIFTV